MEESGREYYEMLAQHPECKAHKGSMVLPAVALFRTLAAHGYDAEGMLNQYGDEMGARFARIVHGVTSVPGIDRLLWNRIDSIMDTGNANKTISGFWEDSTRLPEYYDGTYQYLKGLGIEEI